MIKQKTLLFVGYGSMAKAIACGIAKSDLKDKYRFEIAGRNLKKAQAFIDENGLNNMASCIESFGDSINIDGKIVMLCVKPYALEKFKYNGKADSVYSVMAGVNIETIKQNLASKHYAKIMPNVGAKYQKSSSAVYIEGDIQQEAKEIISSFGCAVFVDSEALVDASIATGGSSPAFLALVAQALIDAGVREGLKRDDATLLVRATFDGFSHLLAQQTPSDIIASITSPGGTTIEGLYILEDRAVRGAFIQACHEAVQKSRKKH